MNFKEEISCLLKTGDREYDKHESTLYVAPFTRPTNILVQHHVLDTGGVFSIERYKNRVSGGESARIYLTPREDHVPTVIVGDGHTLVDIGYRDNVSIMPLHGTTAIKDENQIVVFTVDELHKLYGLEDVLRNSRKPFVLVRPSSFVLTEIMVTDIMGIPARVKVHRNLIPRRFLPDAFFLHVTEPNEIGSLLADTYGFVVTNCAGYVEAHQELQFSNVSDGSLDESVTIMKEDL